MDQQRVKSIQPKFPHLLVHNWFTEENIAGFETQLGWIDCMYNITTENNFGLPQAEEILIWYFWPSSDLLRKYDFIREGFEYYVFLIVPSFQMTYCLFHCYNSLFTESIDSCKMFLLFCGNHHNTYVHHFLWWYIHIM